MKLLLVSVSGDSFIWEPVLRRLERESALEGLLVRKQIIHKLAWFVTQNEPIDFGNADVVVVYSFDSDGWMNALVDANLPTIYICSKTAPEWATRIETFIPMDKFFKHKELVAHIVELLPST